MENQTTNNMNDANRKVAKCNYSSYCSGPKSFIRHMQFSRIAPHTLVSKFVLVELLEELGVLHLDLEVELAVMENG
jgi:hypothetical protein